jgi:predicted peptidase
METMSLDVRYDRTVRLPYLVHVPPQAAAHPAKSWPAILFLHGLGEAGDDPKDLLRTGLPQYVKQHPDFPFVMIAPQCPRLTWWAELSEALASLLDQCLATFPIDPHRLYLTGISMGGYGTWYLGSLWPERFAAVVPICGGGLHFHGFPERVARLKHTPVWAFHGAQDTVVLPQLSQDLVEALRVHGGQVKFTLYPHAGHDSWTETYNNPELYAWLQRHALA